MDDTSVALRIVERLIDKFEPILAAVERAASDREGIQRDIEALGAELATVEARGKTQTEDLLKIRDLLQGVQWYYAWMRDKKRNEEIQDRLDAARESGRNEARRDSLTKIVGGWALRNIWKILTILLGGATLLKFWGFDQLVAAFFQ